MLLSIGSPEQNEMQPMPSSSSFVRRLLDRVGRKKSFDGSVARAKKLRSNSCFIVQCGDVQLLSTTLLEPRDLA